MGVIQRIVDWWSDLLDGRRGPDAFWAFLQDILLEGVERSRRVIGRVTRVPNRYEILLAPDELAAIEQDGLRADFEDELVALLRSYLNEKAYVTAGGTALQVALVPAPSGDLIGACRTEHRVDSPERLSQANGDDSGCTVVRRSACRLEVVTGDVGSTSLDVPALPAVVGRRHNAPPFPDVSLPHRSGTDAVGRRHVLLEQTSSGYQVTDLGSTNGSTLNESPLVPHEPRPLGDGDLLGLAEQIVLRFVAMDDGRTRYRGRTQR